jgi:hypothetical protein
MNQVTYIYIYIYMRIYIYIYIYIASSEGSAVSDELLTYLENLVA